MKKILLVATVQSHISQFHLPLIEYLKKRGNEVHVAAYDNLAQKVGRNLDIVDVVYDVPFTRTPFSTNNIVAYKRLKEIIKKENYDIVHCNTPMGAVIARLVCRKRRKAGLIKVVYTAHGFHFYKGASLINWLIYYPIEKYLSKHTDVLITINSEDYELAVKKFMTKKIEYVPGVGIDIGKFSKVNIDRNYKRKELGIEDAEIMLFSIGELNAGKNHSVVVQAVYQLNNPKIKYVIAGNGPDEEKLQKMITELKLENQIKLIGYRKDIAELLKASDIFVFPSKREGLSVSLMETMASGVTCIVSNIRGNKDLIIDGEGGTLVECNDVEGFSKAIIKCINEPELCENQILFSKQHIEKYSVENVMSIMGRIYAALAE